MDTQQNDRVWQDIRQEAADDTQREPMLASFLYQIILNHASFEDALSFQLAGKLESHALTAVTLRDLIDEALERDPGIGWSAREDIKAVVERDPACRKFSTPLLYFKGFQALQAYRIANYYWRQGREDLALFLQSRISEAYTVDIHPAAKIGNGILIDHATSLVIGETAVVEDNVSMLHEVTLGGTGKDSGDRHPKVRRGVLIAAGAKILGNIEIGEGAKIGGGAVVLDDVAPHTTVVGVPAHPVCVVSETEPAPALSMDHHFNVGGGGI